jgi:hypothetical protein
MKTKPSTSTDRDATLMHDLATMATDSDRAPLAEAAQRNAKIPPVRAKIIRQLLAAQRRLSVGAKINSDLFSGR